MPTVVRLLVASLVLAPALAVAAPPAGAPPAASPGAPPAASPSASPGPPPAAPAPATPPVQRPTSAPTPAASAPVAPSAQPAPTGPSPTGTAQPPGSPPVVPVAPGSPPITSEPPGSTPDPAAASSPPTTPGLAEQLLGPSVNQHPSERAPGPVRSEAESADAEDAAIAAMYRGLYRPPNNPGRINIVARAIYVLAGSVDNTLSGRLGGLSADVGQSFNKFGYAITAVAQFGDIRHTKPERETQTIALVGGGPTLSLGRLALLQRGFLDVRVGYDFLAAPTRVIMDNMATADGMRVPHGPRLSLNMGLLGNSARARKLFHGFGLSLGYQALVGSLRGEWPVTNMLQFGLVYWGG